MINNQLKVISFLKRFICFFLKRLKRSIVKRPVHLTFKL